MVFGVSWRGLYAKGSAWDRISPLAKELVKCMLVLHPEDRLTCEEVLQHPWLTTIGIEESPLGKHYTGRLKFLALQQWVKEVFLGNDITQRQQSRRSHIRTILMKLLEEQNGFGSITPLALEGYKESESTERPLPSIKSLLSTLARHTGWGPHQAEYRHMNSSGTIDDLGCIAIDSTESSRSMESDVVQDYHDRFLAFKHMMALSFSEYDVGRCSAFFLLMLSITSSTVVSDLHLIYFLKHCELLLLNRALPLPMLNPTMSHLKRIFPSILSLAKWFRMRCLQSSSARLVYRNWQSENYFECLMCPTQVSAMRLLFKTPSYSQSSRECAMTSY